MELKVFLKGEAPLNLHDCSISKDTRLVIGKNKMGNKIYVPFEGISYIIESVEKEESKDVQSKQKTEVDN